MLYNSRVIILIISNNSHVIQSYLPNYSLNCIALSPVTITMHIGFYSAGTQKTRCMHIEGICKVRFDYVGKFVNYTIPYFTKLNNS